MQNEDIIQKLTALYNRWQWAQREAADTIKEAMVEIDFLRRTARMPDSICTDPNAGVSGWGKGKDE